MSSRDVIHTESAPAAIGPYSQAIRASGTFVFCSGQIPLDPKSGEVVSGTIEAETERVLENLGAVLEASGASFDQVVRSTIYLTDMQDFQAVNAVYAKRFGTTPPARVTVAVSGLPKGVRVEIDAIAVV